MNKRAMVNAASIVALFGIVGPVVGLLVFAAGMALASGSPSVFVFLVLYGMLFAHVMGGVPALVAGATVAAYAAFRGPVPLLAGGIAGLAGLFGLTGLYGIRNLVDLARDDAGAVQSALLPLFPAVCILASLACTLLTRPWQRRAAATPGGASPAPPAQ